MTYKWGFYALAATLAVLVVAVLIVLAVYDITPIEIISNVMARFIDTPTEYTFVPERYQVHTSEPQTLAEWVVLRHDIEEMYRSDNPDHPPIKLESVMYDSHTLNKYTMTAHDGDTIIFWELLPNDRESYDVIVVIPASGNGGARDVLGLPSKYQQDYYQSVGHDLAKQGYAVYVIENRGYGERMIRTGLCSPDSNSCDGWFLAKKLADMGHDLNDLRSKEVSQVLSHVKKLRSTERVAVMGLSLGAPLAMEAAIKHDVDAVVMASGIGTSIYSPFSEWEFHSTYDDLPKVASVLAPLPMYVSHGKNEGTVMEWEAKYRYTEQYLLRVYELHGSADNFTYVAHEGGHEYHMESVLEFLLRHMPPHQ